MSLKIIYGKAGTGKTEYCFKNIKDNIKNNKKIFIITPEQFSFTAEKKLMNTIENNSIINAEVLTFNRMAYRILNEIGGKTQTNLTNCGKSMIIYDCLHKNLKNLNFLGKTDETIEIISNAITELKKHNISVEQIEEELQKTEDEYLKRKLQDILCIYKSYNNNIENKYIDENDLLTILEEKLPYTHEYNNSLIYIDEFAGFTTQEYKIISKLLNVASDITITICANNLEQPINPDSDIFYDNKKTIQKLLDISKEKSIKVETIKLEEIKRFKNKELMHLEQNLYSLPYKRYSKNPQNIELFLANNQYAEIENISEKIIKTVQENNCSFNDFSIITKNLDKYSSIIKVIFNKYNIPYFMDEKKDLNQNLVIKFLISLLEIYTKNWSYEAMFNYIKCGFLEIENDDIFKLENYCINWGIKGRKWYEEDWNYGIETKEDELNTNRLNEIRRQIIEPIINLKNKIGKEKTVRKITAKLYNFLLEQNIEKILNEKITKLKSLGFLDIANEYETGWNILINILDELVLVFKDEKVSLENYLKILKVGIKNSTLGAIPGTQDQVIIGDVDRSRSHKVKYVFLIGLNDGMFPSINKNEGFLNDKDRENLKESGIELAKGTLEKLYEENFNIYKAFTIPEEKLYLSYSSSDIEGTSLRPSILISKIKNIFPLIKEESDILEAKNEVISKSITFDKLLRNIAKYNSTKEMDDIWFDIYNYYLNTTYKEKLLKTTNALEYTNNPEKIKQELINKLYGKKLKTSVSKLETYRSCPFSFHLKYGLNLKEKKAFKLEFIDTGSFMHEVIDEFFNTLIEENIKPKEIKQEELQKIVDEIIEEKLHLSKNYKFTCTAKFRVQTNRLKSVIKQSIEYIIDEMKMSNFEIVGNEVEFKEGSKYEPIKIKLENGKAVEITGKIDRIDLAKNSDGNYIRIIDYKSSIKDVNLNEVIAGIQIQLLTYLDATCKIEDMLPAGVLYYNLIDASVKAKKRMSSQEIKEELRKQFKMKGLILADVNVVKMMDKTLEKGSSTIIPAYIDKEGNLSKTKSSIVTKEQFADLQKYTKKIIKEIADDILSGNIELKPFYKVRNKKTPCEYCEYKPICGFNKGFCGNDYNYIYNEDKNIILNKIKD